MQLDLHSGFVQASKSSLKDWSMTQDYHTQTVSQFFDQQSRSCWFVESILIPLNAVSMGNVSPAGHVEVSAIRRKCVVPKSRNSANQR